MYYTTKAAEYYTTKAAEYYTTKAAEYYTTKAAEYYTTKAAETAEYYTPQQLLIRTSLNWNKPRLQFTTLQSTLLPGTTSTRLHIALQPTLPTEAPKYYTITYATPT
jgi:hypothetical protein